MSMRHLVITRSITHRDSESIEKYFREINKIPLISPQEEETLICLIKEGDRQAFEDLVKANLRFVISVAKKYQNQGLSLSDLVNEGNIGLISAVKRFDPSRGFRFISYAVWWIRQGILSAIANHARMIRRPVNKVGLMQKVQHAYTTLEQATERKPSVEEIAEITKMNEEDIISALDNTHHMSLDAPLATGEEGSLMDVIENTNAEKTDKHLEHSQSLKKEIDRSLQILSSRQREVICYFFGIGTDYALSLEGIGQKLNLTRERVRQIKDKAIDKLRASKQFYQLKNFLGT